MGLVPVSKQCKVAPEPLEEPPSDVGVIAVGDDHDMVRSLVRTRQRLIVFSVIVGVFFVVFLTHCFRLPWQGFDFAENQPKTSSCSIRGPPETGNELLSWTVDQVPTSHNLDGGYFVSRQPTHVMGGQGGVASCGPGDSSAVSDNGPKLRAPFRVNRASNHESTPVASSGRRKSVNKSKSPHPGESGSQTPVDHSSALSKQKPHQMPQGAVHAKAGTGLGLPICKSVRW